MLVTQKVQNHANGVRAKNLIVVVAAAPTYKNALCAAVQELSTTTAPTATAWENTLMTTRSDHGVPGHFVCTGVDEQPDGSATVHFEIDDEFKTWFKQLHGLKRWSNRRFEQVMLQAVRSMLFEDRLDPQHVALTQVCDDCGGTPDGTHWTVVRVDVLNAPPADPTTGTVCHAGTVEDILNELHPDNPTVYDVFDCGGVRRRFVMGVDRGIVLVGT